MNVLSVRFLVVAPVIFGVAAISVGATYALFIDHENTPGNEFDPQVLDLQIDNTSYYNGAISTNTSWELDNLDGHLFFDFDDLKPGDWGEDTISVHVLNSEAYACFDTELTSNDDVSSNEPELLVDTQDVPGDLFDGELGQNIDFLFWVDDGDNVLEATEYQTQVVAEGTADQVLDNLSVTLADSLQNIFTNQAGDPLQADTNYYIAKAWCYGDMGITPVADGAGVNPTVNGGITCDGSDLDNSTQSDRLTANIYFSSVEATNNPNFECDQVITPTPTPAIATTLVINEVLPDTVCTQGNTEAQWIEVYNGYDFTVNLKDYKITDGNSVIDLVTANSVEIGHGEFALLSHNSAIWINCYNDNDVVTANLGGQLDIDTGLLRLLDDTDTVIDTVIWGSAPNPQPTQNQSFERMPDGLDSAMGTNFEPSDFVVRPTPQPGL